MNLNIQEINHLASLLVIAIEVIAAIAAIIAAIFAHRAERAAAAASSRATVKASEAIRLASLAIERVSFSRTSRLEDERLSNNSDAHFLCSTDHVLDESLEDISSSLKDSKDL